MVASRAENDPPQLSPPAALVGSETGPLRVKRGIILNVR